jgi:hypothetical protein
MSDDLRAVLEYTQLAAQFTLAADVAAAVALLSAR